MFYTFLHCSVTLSVQDKSLKMCCYCSCSWPVQTNHRWWQWSSTDDAWWVPSSTVSGVFTSLLPNLSVQPISLINTSSQPVATRILQRWHSGLDHVNFRTLHQISLYSLIIGFSMNWRLIKEIKSNIMFSACFDYDIDVYYMGAFTVGVLLLGQRI
jgi:hypothetical protein